MPASEITLDVPASAEVNASVLVSARIKNVSPYYDSFRTVIYADEDLLLIHVQDLLSEASHPYNTYFTMPSRDVTLLVRVALWTFLSTGWQWVQDNSATKLVALAGPPPPPPGFSGSISSKELEYDHVKSAIPVY